MIILQHSRCFYHPRVTQASDFSFRYATIGSGNLPVVGSSGLEPPTSRLSGARSNHLSYEPIVLSFGVSRSFSHPSPISSAGGDDGNRTHDPLLAGQVLSQLSYTPIGVI